MNTPPTPFIGVTLDYETAGGYSKYPWYALRDNYCTALSAQGAAPLALPHEVAMVEHYLDTLHGLVITGGNFDVPPEMYGQTTTSDTVSTKPRRSQFEWAITKGALARRMPILGICGGQQLLNVILGGTLIQHIPDSVEKPLAHEQPNPRHEPGHEVAILANTRLYSIVGAPTLAVNSAHHQAVATPAPGAVVNARASDGVIEGIEYPEHPFCLGVQWHPEFSITSGDTKIFAAFVDAARVYAAR
ncbi:MAG: gamma-glutamyl-gamma-aminobutyrate hydrolase family protein [Rickettsiales bacterium]